MTKNRLYHIGFGQDDLGVSPPKIALLSGDPERSRLIAHTYLQDVRSLDGITEEYRRLNILNYEMECGTLFKMAGVYNFSAAAICGVVAGRTVAENVILSMKDVAVKNAIATAVYAVTNFA